MAVNLGFTAHEIKDDETTTENINIIKAWLPVEKVPLLTNEQILLFLLRNDNNVEETKGTIKLHYYWKSKAAPIFNNRSLELRQTLEKIETCIMPKKTQDGCVIIYMRLIETNYKNLRMDEHFKLLFMTIDSVVFADPPPGIICVFNLEGVGFKHLTIIKMGLLRASSIYLQDGLPVKLKRIHCLNSFSLMDKVMNLIRPFSKSNFLDQVLFHSRDMDMAEFHDKYIAKECLPQELGGELPSARELHRQHIDKLMKLEEYFKAEEIQRCCN